MTARYIMIGGFLGAGKTTAMSAFGHWLKKHNLSCGLITNDQAAGLVDSYLLRQDGFAVEEIAGGCFCCRFESLKLASENLTEAIAPDVFLAEPVGSCTDLIATVSIPLQRLYGDRFAVAPLSVMIDPKRLQKRLGLISGRPFSEKVRYIFDKQIEEADILVLNKIDLFEVNEIESLKYEIQKRWPTKTLFCVSVREDIGLENWFEMLLDQVWAPSPTMSLDYELYARGEAALGWVNVLIHLNFGDEIDGNDFLLTFARLLHLELQKLNALIAHLKMTLDNVGTPAKIASLSVIDDDGQIEVRDRLDSGIENGTLLVNLRAQIDDDIPPHHLTNCIELAFKGLNRSNLIFSMSQCQNFRPAPPVPTHRIMIE